MKYFVTIAKCAFKVFKFAANIKELPYVHLFSRALRHLIFMLLLLAHSPITQCLHNYCFVVTNQVAELTGLNQGLLRCVNPSLSKSGKRPWERGCGKG